MVISDADWRAALLGDQTGAICAAQGDPNARKVNDTTFRDLQIRSLSTFVNAGILENQCFCPARLSRCSRVLLNTEAHRVNGVAVIIKSL
jgi:hypothetical protein